ncbi:uncharacterized protein [Montipora capricornis]|uniref:uncharacterized protein n=1 Tax=Montipora capricornis TaxID=246305 RepID=UPI0035F19750
MRVSRGFLGILFLGVVSQGLYSLTIPVNSSGGKAVVFQCNTNALEKKVDYLISKINKTLPSPKTPPAPQQTPGRYGYSVREGDCPGNDLTNLYRDNISLRECAEICSSSDKCNAFMFHDNNECYPKTKTCATTRKTTHNSNVFYDKVPAGYAMRPGDCPGNDIWSIYGFVSLAECARRCSSNTACISFMFYDGRECYPKTKTCSITTKSNPKNFFYAKIA